MSLEIISATSHLERLRAGTHISRHEATVFGEQYSGEVRIEHGVARTFDLPRPWKDYVNLKGEIIATPPNLRDLIPKFIVDLQTGLITQPLLYQPIYRTITDANMPQIVDVSGMLGYVGVVFLERNEGEEIHFGTRERGVFASVPIRHFAAGFEWTEEVVMFDQTWRYQDMIDAIARAHAALLNRLHLRPIIEYAYTPWVNQVGDVPAHGNITQPAYGLMPPEYGPLEQLYWGLQMAMNQATLTINADTGMARRPTIILTHSVNRFPLDWVLRGFEPEFMSRLPPIGGLTQIIEYDDYVIWEGESGYRFVGMPQDRIFLIQPRAGFIELVKQPLQIETGDGDFSRYVAAQLRAGTWRGVVAAPEPYVQVLQLPPDLSPLSADLLGRRAPAGAQPVATR